MAGRRRADAHPDQLRFDLGDGSKPQGLLDVEGDSVFFAIHPTPNTARHVEGLAGAYQRRYGVPGNLRPARVQHISLIGFGKYENLRREVFLAADYAASRVRAAPFLVAFNRLTNFVQKDGHAAVLRGDEGVFGAHALYKALGAALTGAGFELDARGEFTPHMTLLYGPEEVPEEILEEPVAWTVQEFVLVRSRYGQTRHEVLGRWPLRG